MIAPTPPGTPRTARAICGPVLLLILVLGLLGCGGGDDDGTPTGEGAGGRGAALYGEHCASCHGADLRGTDKGPSHLSVVYEPSHHDDESFRRAVREGAQQHHWSFGDMPPVPGLSDEEVTAIIEHVRSVQEREGFEPYPPE